MERWSRKLRGMGFEAMLLNQSKTDQGRHSGAAVEFVVLQCHRPRV